MTFSRDGGTIRAYKPLRCIHCRSVDLTRYDDDGRARCQACGQSFGEFEEARYLFHRIWTDCAVHNEGGRYLKAEFNQLRELLDL